MHCRTLLDTGCDAINLLGFAGALVLPWTARKTPRGAGGIEGQRGRPGLFACDGAGVAGLDVCPSSEASLGQANADGIAGCISATTNITAAVAQVAWQEQGSAAGAAAVRKASELRALIARFPLVASVKAALAATYRDAEWARMALLMQALTAAQAAQLEGQLAERMAAA